MGDPATPREDGEYRLTGPVSKLSVHQRAHAQTRVLRAEGRHRRDVDYSSTKWQDELAARAKKRHGLLWGPYDGTATWSRTNPGPPPSHAQVQAWLTAILHEVPLIFVADPYRDRGDL